MLETKEYSSLEDEQQLFNIIQTFEFTSEAIGSIIFIFDINRRAALVSSSDAKFLGIPEVTYDIPYEPTRNGIVMREYAGEYVRIHESIMEGADWAKGIVGLRSRKGVESIYELSMRALKDKDGNPTGKAAGIYRNVTEYAKAVQREIDLNLATTNVYEEISKRLAEAKDMNSGINSVLQFVGEYLDVSRVYIFENELTDELYGNNTFEWCAPGVEPQIELLQHMSYKDYGYDKIFEASDVFVCADTDKLVEPQRSLLREQGIQAVLHYAIRDNGKFSGFIGLDDCERTREGWSMQRGEVKMLAFVAELLSMYLMKERNFQRQLKFKVRGEKYHRALAHNASYTIVADITKDTILNEIITSEKQNLLASMGLKAPCSYNEANNRFLDINDVIVLIPGGELFFTSEGLMEMYEKGIRHESVEYYVPRLEEYYRVMPLLGRDPETGHIIAHIYGYKITEKVLEERRQRKVVEDALRQAERANAAKTEFLNNMSHDIRTPMNAILGYTHLASNNCSSRTRVLDYLEKIKASSNHLLALINDILDMSSIESGKMKFEEAEMFLPELIDELQNTIQGQAELKDINFVVYSKRLKHKTVLTDKVRLSQVLLNCLSNAIKFTPNGGTVTFSVEEVTKDDGCCCAEYEFRIKDTGIGMKPDFLKHVFEPFERERNSTVSGIQGTGLGMSIVKNIVDMMQGTVRCESELGKGTEFIINLMLCLPESQTTNVKNEETNKTQDITNLEGLNILVVEDNDLNREIAEVIIGELGANVQTASDGHIAVQMVKEAPKDSFDVILMDIQMPVMNGVEATRAIRNLPDKEKANIPIIAMTANAFIEDKKEALEVGMQAYITKPIQVDSLVFAIREVLK